MPKQDSIKQNVDAMKEEIIELQIEYTHQQDYILLLDKVILDLRSQIDALKH